MAQKNDNKSNPAKTELANRIARQSKRVSNTYEAFEGGVVKIIRSFFSFLDRILFNKHSKLVAFVLALGLYAFVNYNTLSGIIAKPLEYSRSLSNVPVVANYNSDTFEISGLQETVDVVVSGDATSVNNSTGADAYVIADLEGLAEGTHEIKLSGEGFGPNVTVAIDPSNVTVTLKKKTTAQFDISYDYIHMDQLENIYSVGVPEFESTKVNVRASEDTLNTIAFIKALIDVSNQVDSFDQNAKLVAYDENGNPVEADIIPSTVRVHVEVSSPNKTVPIEVQITGEVPDNKAIESITADQQSVIIYGNENVLREIDKVVVTLNASTITKDATILRPIVLPTGVNSSNINQITLNIVVSDLQTKRVTDVPINYINNVHNFKASQPNNKTTTTVIVSGTADNIANVQADTINVYIDMIDAVPGLQEFQLYVDQPTNGIVKYSLEESTYELNVLGESESSEDGEGEDQNG